MTTEELDALDAMIREAHFEVIEDYEGTHLATIPASVETLDALVNAAPRLLAEAREAATLRAKLAEVTGQRDELREALSEMLKRHGSTCHRREFGADRCRYPCQSCDFDVRVRKALEAAR